MNEQRATRTEQARQIMAARLRYIASVDKATAGLSPAEAAIVIAGEDSVLTTEINRIRRDGRKGSAS